MTTADVVGSAVLSMPQSIFGTAIYPLDHVPPHDEMVWPQLRVGVIGGRRRTDSQARPKNDIATASEVGETHPFTAGDTETILDFTDVASLTTVTASAYAGTPPLVEDRDYSLADSGASLDDTFDSIAWLPGALVLPDDGSTVTVDYERNVIEEGVLISRAYTVRAVVHAKGDAEGPRSSEAQRKGLELEAWVEGKRGSDIAKAGSDYPVIISHIQGSGPTQPDRGASASTYFVDFVVIACADLVLDTVQRVRKVDETVQRI